MSDISITPANALQSAAATLVQGVIEAANTVLQGKAVWKNDNNLWELADANGTVPTGLTASKIGIAMTGGVGGQPLVVCTKDPNFKLGGTMGVTSELYVSKTAGGVTETAADLTTGSKLVSLGLPVDATYFNLAPSIGGLVP